MQSPLDMDADMEINCDVSESKSCDTDEWSEYNAICDDEMKHSIVWDENYYRILMEAIEKEMDEY